VHWIDGNNRGFFVNGAQVCSDHQRQQLQHLGGVIRQLADA